MYDEAYASVYDTIFPPDAAVVHGVVQTLTAFAAAPGAAILEYGAGTGRIAIPMSDSFAVTAVEPSPHMRDRLVQKRSRTGGPTVVAGDMLTRLEIGPQALVYCVLGTFACITDHDEQERALQKMSAHVEPGGRLVVESFNPRALADHLGSEPIKIAQALDEDGTLLNSTYRRGEDGKLVAEHSWTAPESLTSTFLRKCSRCLRSRSHNGPGTPVSSSSTVGAIGIVRRMMQSATGCTCLCFDGLNNGNHER